MKTKSYSTANQTKSNEILDNDPLEIEFVTKNSDKSQIKNVKNENQTPETHVYTSDANGKICEIISTPNPQPDIDPEVTKPEVLEVPEVPEVDPLPTITQQITVPSQNISQSN